MTRGLSGIAPNLRDRPLRALQLGPILVAMTWRALREAPRHDVVHAHWVYPGGLVAMIAARRAGGPFIVTSHGGEIQVESSPGRGSVFRVRMPAAVA